MTLISNRESPGGEAVSMGRMSRSLPWAVVLHIAYTGYGVVRSLSAHGIPIIAFQKDLTEPEARSGLCERIVQFDNDDQLLSKLVRFARSTLEKPVLFITSDVYVRFFLGFRPVLEDNFHIHYPISPVVELLLNKDKFTQYAVENRLPIPKSMEVFSVEDMKSEVLKNLAFPVVVKPFDKSSRWLAAKLEKAYLVHSREDLKRLYRRVAEIEPHLLVQEWIPGPDSNVEYCLTYFDGNSRCLAAFTGAKIRQWPIGTGSTASTRPVENDWIKSQTLRIFTALRYKGFGSIEYKKHGINGRYYITEPTVGRPNQQSFVATANGMNIPLIAYESLTGLSLRRPSEAVRPVIYIDEWADLASALVHFTRGQASLRECLKLIKQRKAFRYFDRRDVRVFLRSLVLALRYCGRVLMRKVRTPYPSKRLSSSA